ncbi:MAG: ADP-forming succinate--CoA ligase subunit beta [Acidobacteria bacterium]|nr:ADP-forming succinate--CoA ligase subunit beta [Acidobacteriota bacterium]MCY3966839.1 ADP-forming succinate--CoA ligase subunit beta [Acidobacteriota bacterium]
MKIHEFQAKEILRRFGARVPQGKVIEHPGQAAEICRDFGGRSVVKAQIHAGGRGKGGGVKLAASPEEAERLAGEILGMQLTTHQTGPEGQQVRKVLIEEALDIELELYLGVTLDRAAACPVLMASRSGGMDIEEVARTEPDAILRELIDPQLGVLPFQCRRIASGLGFSGGTARQIQAAVASVVAAYLETDASLVEINPLMVDSQGDVYTLDAKMNFDDNAMFRRPEIAGLRDVHEENPLEVEASGHGISYIKLDGSIGCMVNGAGLAMATMDIIKLYGSEPANFLDVGGSASQEAVESAFRIILSDEAVKAVLINIFGGIARTDRIARGVVAAIEELAASGSPVGVPVIVRLEGTNVEEGREVLERADFDFIVAGSMGDAAQRAVEALGA